MRDTVTIGKDEQGTWHSMSCNFLSSMISRPRHPRVILAHVWNYVWRCVVSFVDIQRFSWLKQEIVSNCWYESSRSMFHNIRLFTFASFFRWGDSTARRLCPNASGQFRSWLTIQTDSNLRMITEYGVIQNLFFCKQFQKVLRNASIRWYWSSFLQISSIPSFFAEVTRLSIVPFL